MAARTFNVHEALEYLKDLEVSSSDDSNFEDVFTTESRLVIGPPSNVTGRESDKYSEEENGKNQNHLNKTQLSSNAHLTW